MTDEPREYDREYTSLAGTTVRRRLGYSHDQGEITRFVVPLEYRHEGAWPPIVRYDHDPSSGHEHDVTDEGHHFDVYQDGERSRTGSVAPPLPAGVALDFAEDQLNANIQRFTRRVEDWHEIRTQ